MDKSRRHLLKIMAAAPLFITFGFAGEALARFAKPTMKPSGIFDPSDQPSAVITPEFHDSDLPVEWACLPFIYRMKIPTFSPEKEVIREIPGYILRLPDDRIVAYSRLCPRGRGCILNYIRHPRRRCGCAPEGEYCCCTVDIDNPVFVCNRDASAFDIANEGRVIRGPAPRPPVSFQLDRKGNFVSVVRLESSCIA